VSRRGNLRRVENLHLSVRKNLLGRLDEEKSIIFGPEVDINRV
jgi:hypothetical protein